MQYASLIFDNLFDHASSSSNFILAFSESEDDDEMDEDDLDLVQENLGIDTKKHKKQRVRTNNHASVFLFWVIVTEINFFYLKML